MAAANAIRALLYLRLTTLRNIVLSRFRRLRQPKYLVGAIIGIGYLYLVFFRRSPRRPGASPGAALDSIVDDATALVATLGAAAVLLLMALNWVLRRPRAALGFSEAEIAFLFPAPLSRHSLIHYRLISLGLRTLFTALILALLSARWQVMADTFIMRFTGWWLIFATLSLHTVGSSFTITRWMDGGASALRIQLGALMVIAVVVGLPLAWLWQHTPAGEMIGMAALQNGPVAWLLLPFKVMLGPLLASDAPSFLLALAPALVIYAAHYLWVLHSQVSFEEGSIARAEKVAAAVAAMRAGNFRLASGKQKARRAPFDLGRAWRPELAFLWKNLLASAEYLRPRNALITAALIGAACFWFRDSVFFQDLRPKLAMVAMVIAVYAVFFGPQLARQDLRSDLPNTDILKTYPLHGWQIMLGEMLTPVAILTVLLWLMLFAATVLMPSFGMPRMSWLTPGVRAAAIFSLALLAPLLCMSQLLIVNAATVLFPAWTQAGGNQSQQGIDVMGQRIVFMFGQMLAMMIMFVPAGIAGVLTLLLARAFIGVPVALCVTALVVAAVLVVEIGLGVGWLGGRFERLDLSRELRP